MSASERRPRIVKVKDLKPKRIKDYLEYKPTISRCKERRIEKRNLILFTFDSSQSLHSNSREKGVKKNIHLFDIERVKLKKRVNTVHVRDQKHELTPPRNRKYPCDNGYKEVTVLPSRDIVYNQVKQLIGLRHKPITQQDALSRSDSQPRFYAKAGPVVSVRDIPFVILLKQNIEAPP
ncbi:hypothetical protein GQ457_16G018580 [Hibiscus cannabinus]